MFRDCNRSEHYFVSYIEDQDRRIERFNRKLEDMIATHRPEIKIQQCHRFLSGLLHDKFYAQYSLGCEKENLKETFFSYLDHIQAQGLLTYQEVLETLSLAIVFHIQPQSILSDEDIPQDDLLQMLYDYGECGENTGNWGNSKLLFPDTSSVFLDVLQGSLTANDLREYIQNRWYEDNSDSSWFESDRRDDDTYCGYWCFVGAAVALIKGFEHEAFKDCKYFPVDIL